MRNQLGSWMPVKTHMQRPTYIDKKLFFRFLVAQHTALRPRGPGGRARLPQVSEDQRSHTFTLIRPLSSATPPAPPHPTRPPFPPLVIRRMIPPSAPALNRHDLRISDKQSGSVGSSATRSAPASGERRAQPRLQCALALPSGGSVQGLHGTNDVRTIFKDMKTNRLREERSCKRRRQANSKRQHRSYFLCTGHHETELPIPSPLQLASRTSPSATLPLRWEQTALSLTTYHVHSEGSVACSASLQVLHDVLTTSIGFGFHSPALYFSP